MHATFDGWSAAGDRCEEDWPVGKPIKALVNGSVAVLVKADDVGLWMAQKAPAGGFPIPCCRESAIGCSID